MYREKRIKEKKSFRLTAIVLFTLLLSIGVISTTSFADDSGTVYLCKNIKSVTDS